MLGYKIGRCLNMRFLYEMTIESLVHLPLQGFFLSSNDGKNIYFYSNKTGTNEIYQFSIASKSLKQLTHGEPPKTVRFPFKISKNDKFLFYLKDPVEGNEKYNIFSFNVESAEEKQLTNTPNALDFYNDIFNDASKIIFVSDRENSITQIFISDIDGSNAQQLTHHNQHVNVFDGGVVLSHDDKSIAYSTNETSLIKNCDLWIYSLNTGKTEKILSLGENSKEIGYCWFKDDKSIVVGTDHFGFQKVGILNLETKEQTWFGSEPYDEYFACLDEERNQILVLRSDGANIKIISYNIADKSKKELPLPDGFYFPNDKIILNDRLLIRNTDSNHRIRAILYNLTTDTFDEIIPAEHGKYTDSDFTQSQYIYYESENGTRIYSLLYVPRNINKSDKNPALIMPHGGPTGHYANIFREEAQIYCNNGYIMLFPNVRGSDGYGIEFRDSCINDWAGKDLVDIEYGVKYLQNLPFVDKNRIGILGASYGGYMTYMAMTKIPNYFKAGSAVAGISDLLLNYEETKKTFPALSKYFEEQMGVPDNEETVKLWKDRSAINFLQQMTGKLQIIHTTNDPRCTLSQAEVVKEKLIKMGKKEGEDFDYQIFGNAGHGSSEIAFRLQFFQKQLEFFNKNLK